MVSTAILDLLHRYAQHAAQQSAGIIVEIGAYRGGSTIALAKGVREVGRGRVTSIDPHLPATGIYGGKFSQDDHQIYLNNLQRFGVDSWVSHLCTDSHTAAGNWTSPIDLLWIDGDHSYAGVASDIIDWIPLVGDHGIVVFDDVEPGSEVEAAIRDHLPFSRFRRVEQIDHVIVFRKEHRSRTLYLCGGLQSSGSTLVSWCFLQRHDLDGIFDMENSVIHQDFSRVHTESVWLKMTIGSFRLIELVSFYEAQGWTVKPFLVHRDLVSVYRSLRGKLYGFDGATGDEPPIFIRVQRYLADLEAFRVRGWPVLSYENLVRNPRGELERLCTLLGLAWDEAMVSWPKNETSIAYMANGNPTFRGTKEGTPDLFSSIAKFQQRESTLKASNEVDYLETKLSNLDRFSSLTSKPTDDSSLNNRTLPPVKFCGTRRQFLETEYVRLNQKLNKTEYDLNRILNHVVFGRLLKLWKRFINSSFPAKGQEKQG
ncbi:MAG: class I SAM-dependent methyltransferase [Rhodocyclaceae bacterium]|nr:class I SAM-dependent methyltransferase [Rhodocyclaceae bacterium]MCO5097915.1 class I SAM-dependent methyltransferase [Rhodocyclaceae bacterium]